MKKLFALFVTPLIFLTMASEAQNIFSALHHNELREYKFGLPVQIIETNIFYSSNNTQVEKNIKTYDRSGMLLTEDRYDEDGKLTAKLTYTNDTIKRLTMQRVFERWTSLGYNKETAIYFYDDKNFLIRIKDVDANSNTIRVSELVNNDKGDPTALHLYDGNGNSFGVEKAEYFYDKNIAVTTVFSNDGRKLSTDSLKINFHKTDTSIIDKSNYNEHGDVLSGSTRNLNGSLTFYEYEYIYDTIGNCIDEKIYSVTMKGNGKKKRKLDRHFKKEIIYNQS